MLTGDSPTRDARTRSEGTGVSPVSSNSSTSTGQSPEVFTMRAASASFTMLITSSPVSRMFRRVSLGPPARELIEMPISGGRLVMALK